MKYRRITLLVCYKYRFGLILPMHRAVIAIFALALLPQIGLAAAVDCAIEVNKSDEFFVEQRLRPDGSAAVDIGLKIPYSPQCLAEKRVQGSLDVEFGCKGNEARISDILFRFIGSLSEKSVCTLKFDGVSQKLIVQASSEIGLVATEKNGYWELTFDKWNLSTEKLNSSPLLGSIPKKTLRVSLPQGSRVVSFFPMATGRAEGDSAVVWDDFPSKTMAVRYTAPEPLEKNPVFLLLVALLACAAGYLLYGHFIERKKLHDRAGFLAAKRDALVREMKDLEAGYFKRQVDEQTYKRRYANLKIRLAKLRAEREMLEGRLAGNAEKKKSAEGENNGQGGRSGPAAEGSSERGGQA